MVEDLSESTEFEAAPQSLKPHEIAEIEKRLAEHHANPQDVVPWSTVKTHLQIGSAN